MAEAKLFGLTNLGTVYKVYLHHLVINSGFHMVIYPMAN